MTETTYRQPSPQEVERAMSVIENATDADVLLLMATACHAAFKHRILGHLAKQVADEDEPTSKAVWSAFDEVQ